VAVAVAAGVRVAVAAGVATVAAGVAVAVAAGVAVAVAAGVATVAAVVPVAVVVGAVPTPAVAFAVTATAVTALGAAFAIGGVLVSVRDVDVVVALSLCRSTGGHAVVPVAGAVVLARGTRLRSAGHRCGGGGRDDGWGRGGRGGRGHRRMTPPAAGRLAGDAPMPGA
jgi:hypothetical protein